MENGQGTQTVAVPPVGLPWQSAGTGSRAFKGGLYGPTGSGKTTTAAILAVYLCQRLKKTDAYMLDSEGGGDYVDSIFKQAGIKLKIIRTREFGVLVTAFEQMGAQDDVILVDSITHFSEDVIKAYLAAKRRARMELNDFNAVYGTWRMFSEPFMSSHLNAIVCGRMGSVYESVVNDEGKTEMYRTDSKMKANDQFGHEPDFLLEMEQVLNADAHRALQAATTKPARAKIAQEIKRNSTMNIVATVRKDRTRLVMGQVFTFIPVNDDARMTKAVQEAFKPVIDWHLHNKTQEGIVDTGATRALLAPTGNEFDWQEKKRRKEVALDEIKATLTKYFPSTTSPRHKQAMIRVSESVFKVKSWTAIEQLALETLEAAVASSQESPVSPLESVCLDVSAELQDAKAGAVA